MTKLEAINSLKALYRVGNAADSTDTPEHEAWTHPDMAGEFCRSLDHAFRALTECGVLTQEDCQAIYDTL